jgi:hypothetical protein
MIRPKVCVFAGSSTPSDPAVLDAARKLGAQLGEAGYDLVYGGGIRGVMGAVAEAAQKAGANVTAITIEKYAAEPQLTGAKISSVLTEAERFSAFLLESPIALFVLPGGPGSLREAMQGLENAVYENGPPVIFVKTGQYLKGIKQYFNQAVLGGMVKTAHKECLKVWLAGSPLGNILKADKSSSPQEPSPKNP